MTCCCLHQAIAWTGVSQKIYYVCYSWLANELCSLLLLLLTRWLQWHIVSCCFALLCCLICISLLSVQMYFNWLVVFHKWAILSAWVCYLTQLRVFSDALWIRCTVCIEYSPKYLNYLKPWTCVYLRYTSGTALRDTRTVDRYTYTLVIFSLWGIHLSYMFCFVYFDSCIVKQSFIIYNSVWLTQHEHV